MINCKVLNNMNNMDMNTTLPIATMQTQCIYSTLTCFSFPCASTTDCDVSLCVNKLMII